MLLWYTRIIFAAGDGYDRTYAIVGGLVPCLYSITHALTKTSVAVTLSVFAAGLWKAAIWAMIIILNILLFLQALFSWWAICGQDFNPITIRPTCLDYGSVKKMKIFIQGKGCLLSILPQGYRNFRSMANIVQ